MDEADVIVDRLNKEKARRGVDVNFDYYAKTLRNPSGEESGTVLVIENLKGGFFNLEWLDSVLGIQPRISVTNVTVSTTSKRIKVYLKYE